MVKKAQTGRGAPPKRSLSGGAGSGRSGGFTKKSNAKTPVDVVKDSGGPWVPGKLPRPTGGSQANRAKTARRRR